MRLKEFLANGGTTQDIDNQWNKMNVNERANYIKNDLLRRGYTQNQTAAILGNLLQENSNLGTHTQNSSSGAVGIAQWLGSRKKNIVAQGKHSSISGQLDFLDQEIKGKGAWTNNVGGKNAFFGSDNVEQLTRIFRKDFERPGEHEANDTRRIKNAYNILGQQYIPGEGGGGGDFNVEALTSTMPKEMFEGLNDWGKFSTAAKKNPELLNMFSPDIKSQFEENTRLENERLKQEEIKSQVEAENQRIQMALQQKQQQRAQILSMVPQSQSITYGDIKPQMQKGGWIPFSERTPKTEKIRTFYNDMITSDWYRDRLEANGYNSKLNPGNWFSDGAQDEADYRARRVKYTRVHNLDMTKPPYSAEEAERYKAAKQAGTHWMPRTNEISRIMNDPMMDMYNIDPDSNVAHEFGHPESAGRLNSYEYGLLEDKLSNRTKEPHDRDPNESKADINALRYNLYKQGLFDPKTGKYKTKSGKFESSLLHNVRTDFITERLLQNYDTKNLEYLLNTIAMNDNSNNLENIV